jgi:hypothetical protein
MSKTRVIREHKILFQNLGVKIEDIETKGLSHPKFKVEYLGKTRIFVCPSSPSDVRGIKNFKSSVNQWIRSIKNV